MLAGRAANVFGVLLDGGVGSNREGFALARDVAIVGSRVVTR
jgi:hypothetical protein